MRRVKQPFGGKFLFAFFQQLEQCTGAGNFHLFDHQLVTAFAGKSGDSSGCRYFKPVFGFDGKP